MDDEHQTADGRKPSRLRSFPHTYPATLLLLALLALLAYGGAALTPSLLGDEWGYVGSYIGERGPICPEASIRPFSTCWLWLVFRVVDLNIHAFHAAAVLMSFIAAVLLLILLDQLLPDWPTFNGATAAVYLVFPADVTRTWLAGNIVYGTAVYLAAICFLAAFWRGGRWWTWVAGTAMLLLALGTYEIALGVVVALSGLAFLFSPGRSWARRLALLTPALLAVLFAGWRWIWQQSTESAFGHDIGNVVMSPAGLFERLIAGVRYTLQGAWTDTVSRLLPALPVGALPALFVIGGLVLGPFVIYYFIGRGRAGEGNIPPQPEAETRGQIKHLVMAAAAGVVVLIMGYFPIILAVYPGTEYTASRTHHIPGIGAALISCALLFILAALVGRAPRSARTLALTALWPVLGLGVAAHLLVQQETRRAWADQTLIWQSLFEDAPDIVNGTEVLFMLIDYSTPTKGPRPFISGSWGASSALRVLYGKNGLNAHFAAAWPPRVLSIEGQNLILSNFGVREFPAELTLLYSFGKNERILTRVPEWTSGDYMMPLGLDRILSTSTQLTDYRWLVLGK